MTQYHAIRASEVARLLTDIELDIVSSHNAVIGISSRPSYMAASHSNQCPAQMVQHNVGAAYFGQTFMRPGSSLICPAASTGQRLRVGNLAIRTGGRRAPMKSGGIEQHSVTRVVYS